jgi:hypothetical protein
MRHSKNLQAHRLKAFYATLLLIENKIEMDKKFIKGYADVYHFPKMKTRKNLKTIDQQIKAINIIKYLYEAHNPGAPAKKKI